MNKNLKKGIIISLSVLTVFFLLLLALPIVFKDKILVVAKEQINAKLNAKVDFQGFNLSFLRSFPNASARFENLRIVGTGEFKKDTLLYSESVDLEINLKSLFSDKGYEVLRFQVNNSRIYAHVLPNNKDNWSIMKEDSVPQPIDTSAMKFNVKLNNIVFNNAHIVYLDEVGEDMKVEISNLSHFTSGDFAADSSLLITKTSIDSLTFWMGGVKYLSKANVEFNAIINANLNAMKFTFDKNSSRINDIKFSFNGWFQKLGKGVYDMNLKLNTEQVSFKSILSMIPAMYTNSFKDLKAGGDVKLTGSMKGKMVDDLYPAFDFKLLVSKAWFKYPSLSKSVDNINIACRINNPGKTMDATVVDVSKLSLVMAGNPFLLQMKVAYPMSDPDLFLKAVGKINLGTIKDIYPLAEGTHLNGIFDMDIHVGGRMSYYDLNQYDKFTFGGKLDIQNMQLKMKDLAQEVSISKANMLINNRFINLTTLQLKIGRNDLSASGKLENFVAYALHDKTLKGELNLHSNSFNVSDFMTKSGAPQTDSEPLTVVEVPKNIDFALQANFNKLQYEKMTFAKAHAALKVEGGEVKIQNLSTEAFGGNMVLSGLYSTADITKPTVKFNVALTEILFTDLFKQVETVQKFAPVFEKATGRFTTKLTFSTLLMKDMMPELKTLNADGSFSTKTIGLKNVPTLKALATVLKMSDSGSTTLKDVSFKYAIKDGRLSTQPFDVQIADVKMNIGGSTGLDKTIAYNGKVQLPAKFNLGKFSNVGVKIGGTFASPKVELDLANTLKTEIADAKAKVVAEVNKQVDNAKQKAMDEARIQKEAAVKAAQEKANQLRADAQQLSNKLISEAENQANVLVSKATNPITKRVAQEAAKKIVDEAKRKAADANAKAEQEANKLVEKANAVGN